MGVTLVEGMGKIKKKKGLPKMRGEVRATVDYIENASCPLSLSKHNRQVSRQFSHVFAYQLCRSYSVE
jgi:hypothetical protein